jgi:hypothetical protein
MVALFMFFSVQGPAVWMAMVPEFLKVLWLLKAFLPSFVALNSLGW